MTPHDLLIKVLDIIEFADDKEKFANEYFRNINLQAVANLSQNLSEEQKNNFKQKLSEISTEPQKVGDVLQSFFSESQLQFETEKVSKEMLRDFLGQISPALSEEQKQNLTTFLGTIATA